MTPLLVCLTARSTVKFQARPRLAIGWEGRGTSRGEDKMLPTTPRAGATVGIDGARLVLPGRCRRCRPRRVAAKAKQSALPSELSDLLEIASRTQRGEGLTTVDREAMERACDSLVASTGSKSVVSRSTLSKTWRLVLTTEKVRKAFGLRLKRETKARLTLPSLSPTSGDPLHHEQPAQVLRLGR